MVSSDTALCEAVVNLGMAPSEVILFESAVADDDDSVMTVTVLFNSRKCQSDVIHCLLFLWCFTTEEVKVMEVALK